MSTCPHNFFYLLFTVYISALVANKDIYNGNQQIPISEKLLDKVSNRSEVLI